MRPAILGLTVTAGALAASAAMAGSGSIAPRDAVIRSATDKVTAGVDTYCVTGEPAEDGTSVGMCADAVPPTEPPRPRLEIRPGETIDLRLLDNPNARDDPRRVWATLARVTKEGPRYFGRITVTGPDVYPPRRFGLELPRDLRRANALHLFVRYRDGGDASYHAGLRP